MAQIKKWKIGISTASSSTIYVYIDAPTATEAIKIAKMQNPNGRVGSTATEVK